jgi:hypothetical protein
MTYMPSGNDAITLADLNHTPSESSSQIDTSKAWPMAIEVTNTTGLKKASTPNPAGDTGSLGPGSEYWLP